MGTPVPRQPRINRVSNPVRFGYRTSARAQDLRANPKDIIHHGNRVRENAIRELVRSRPINNRHNEKTNKERERERKRERERRIKRLIEIDLNAIHHRDDS